MNPWAVHNWLTKLDIKSVLVENVPEFVDWGRLTPDGRPDKAHKGEHFQAWFLTFPRIGLPGRVADAKRRRLRRRHHTHPLLPDGAEGREACGLARALPRQGGHRHVPRPPSWRGAREIIDWSNPGRSLLDDPKYQKKPLSEKTRHRNARGLERFGGPVGAALYPAAELAGRGVGRRTASSRRRGTHAHGRDARRRLPRRARSQSLPRLGPAGRSAAKHRRTDPCLEPPLKAAGAS